MKQRKISFDSLVDLDERISPAVVSRIRNNKTENITISQILYILIILDDPGFIKNMSVNDNHLQAQQVDAGKIFTHYEKNNAKNMPENERENQSKEQITKMSHTDEIKNCAQEITNLIKTYELKVESYDIEGIQEITNLLNHYRRQGNSDDGKEFTYDRITRIMRKDVLGISLSDLKEMRDSIKRLIQEEGLEKIQESHMRL